MKRLILVVGASGAGKDSLLKEAKIHFKENPTIHFIRRYITRQPGEFEDNFYIGDDAFEVLKSQDFFFSYWYAHDLKYGIPKRELESLKENETAIISVSRAKINDFEENLSGTVTTVHVTADPSTIQKRLEKRKRETFFQIETRLQRLAIPVKAKNLMQFDNNQELRLSAPLFISLLEKIVDSP
jgi:ribose 1,5-bisphosphokinase